MPKSNSENRPWAATRQGLAGELGKIDGVLPGSVGVRRMRCGKAGCACKGDPPALHGPYIQWTRTVDAKTVTRFLGEEQLARYQPWFDNARRVKELVAMLEVASVNALEAERQLKRSAVAKAPARRAGPRPAQVGQCP
ncbi:MAG: DUF6788 family protein [Acidimicrobiales bacterium]